jgi:hypothetical protein
MSGRLGGRLLSFVVRGSGTTQTSTLPSLVRTQPGSRSSRLGNIGCHPVLSKLCTSHDRPHNLLCWLSHTSESHTDRSSRHLATDVSWRSTRYSVNRSRQRRWYTSHDTHYSLFHHYWGSTQYCRYKDREIQPLALRSYNTHGTDFC